ncbi:MAG: flagellar assembly protein FliH [Pseudorhodoplanes sp.]|nr:flagellar assembly protein FliH [Pseudorhodoplanes sp.]
MTATAPTRFLFDTDFGASAKAANVVALDEHKAAVAEAETRGYRNGFAAGAAEARAETERRLALALEQVSGGLEGIARGLAGVESRLEAEAVDVAVTVARMLAPELIAREPFAEIAALATECFRHLIAAPHIVVRVNENLYTSAREQLDRLASQSGYAGRLVILSEPDIAEGDCRIEWADGGVVRSRAEIEAAIAETVGRFLAGRQSPVEHGLKGPEQ